MRIGLIDVDGHNFPNLPLMKLSAWHKSQGDSVEWYEPMIHEFEEPLDRVYMSKVFSDEYSPDYPYYVNAREVIKGGSGYCISLVNGKEEFDKSKHFDLPYEIEHIYPDYSIYYNKIPEIQNTAYGFLTRGCQCDCNFCHVSQKEGKCSEKVADLSEFWKGQKNIVLLDPNITGCRQCEQLFQQLIDSRANIDFSQGLRIHMMNEKRAEMLKNIKIKNIHFAWDRYEDKNIVVPKFEMVKNITQLDKRKLTVYVLTNFDTTHEQDLERIYILRDLGYWPYVMIYNKDDFVIKDKNGKPIRMKPVEELLKKYTMEQIQHFSICWRMQRWVNMRAVFENVHSFEEYKK